MRPNIGYKKVIADPVIQNFNPGLVSSSGSLGIYEQAWRVLCFKNITEAVELKYNLPQNILLAIVWKESTGVEFLPNSSNDGGFGLAHMQPSLAKLFSLKTYKSCDSLICHAHALNLRKVIWSSKRIDERFWKKNDEREKLFLLDDRLHRVINLDCVGRMLAQYSTKPPNGYNCFEAMLLRYAGFTNYSNYKKNINNYMSLLSNKKFLNEAEDYFNKRNPNLIINGKSANFKNFLKLQESISFYNYELNTYIENNPN